MGIEQELKNVLMNLLPEEKIEVVKLLMQTEGFKYEVTATCQDGGKYSEFIIDSIKPVIFNYDDAPELSAKVYQTDNCFVKP